MKCVGGRGVAFLSAVLALVGLSMGSGMAQFHSPKFVKATASAPKTIVPGKPFTVTVTVMVDTPYHIQGNPPKEGYIPTVASIAAPAGFVVGKITYPTPLKEKVAGDILPVYEGKIQITAEITANRTVKAGKVTLPITIKFQGCNERACFPPSMVATSVVITLSPAAANPVKHKADSDSGALILAQASGTTPLAITGTENNSNVVSVPGFHAEEIAQFEAPGEFVKWLQGSRPRPGQADAVTNFLNQGDAFSFAKALGLIYLLGLALNLTPCVYPIIPVTIGYFGRQAASGARTQLLSVCYALGMTLMYSVLGVFAGLSGKAFGAQLNSPIVLIGFSLVMFALGLSMFDRPNGMPIWELQLPSSLTSGARSRTGYVGALLMGLMVGLVAAPCIGPVVVALIQYVGATQNALLGLVTFFFLGMGLATPYLLLGFGIVKGLPRAGEWMVAVKHIFGLMLFGMGLYYLRNLFSPSLYRTVVMLFAIGSGLYLLFLDKAGRAAPRFFLFKRAIGVAAIVFGIGFVLPKPEANMEAKEIAFETVKDYPALQARLEQARRDNKEVLIDFWATWCAECKEMESKTFHNQDVVRATEKIVALRVQLEDPDSAIGKPFKDTFKIVGLPTIVHLVPHPAGEKTARL